ncbi:hypothetical protein K461DRAFT_267974 [Myriangium duriaei CBS 260.36]|uniref:Histone transcription regulator 3 homolog n=1 Tax=Myriangium duriaei CBS 260.36 TaxID=1168546 RepID=A0A9P4J0U0_9PEZI|nr:hypothetical protein K461DRAFT_267974 [Myriangium duriaei CBS 260.36]
MASFKALNLESDDESDIEVDDTKEIQIEDALKLYQTALKFHSDGPDTYAEAAKAYKELFESEIFKYPESQSELKRIELYGPSPDQDPWADDQVDVFVEPLLASENAPSTLPQILHLAHKNYGDFILADLAARQRSGKSTHSELGWFEIQDAATSALDHLVEALDKDDTDLDVWNQTSTIGAILDSNRVVRFCLEAILDDEENALEDLMLFPGFSESAAGQKLCLLVRSFNDALSMLQSPLEKIKRKRLNAFLRRKMRLYDSDLDVTQLQSVTRAAKLRRNASATYHISLGAPRSWSDFTQALAGLSSGEEVVEGSGSVGGIVQFSEQVKVTKSRSDDDDNMILDARFINFPNITDIDAIFPGLDKGQPTAPVSVFGDVSQLQHLVHRNMRQLGLSTRKRSSDLAALENQDTGRVKSKRLRARESLVDGMPAMDPASISAKKIKRDPFEETESTDAWCFRSADEILRKLGVETFDRLASHRPQRTTLSDENGSTKTVLDPAASVACSDLYRLLVETPERLPKSSASKNNEDTAVADSPHNYLLAALENDTTAQTKIPPKAMVHIDHGLKNMLDHINKASLSIPEVSFVLLQLLLFPGSQRLRPRLSAAESSYTGHSWPENMKASVIKILISCDDYLSRTCANLLDKIAEDFHAHARRSEPSDSSILLGSLVHMVQSIWELHLDVLAQIKFTSPSEVTYTVSEQRARVDRWAEQARVCIELRRDQSTKDTVEDVDELGLRYVWAVAAQIKVTDYVDPQDTLKHLNELRGIFVDLEGPVIHLPNNALMPVLSLEAIDREIAKLTTSDFFNKVFDSSQGDPTAIIEGLEPLMELVHSRRFGDPLESPNSGDQTMQESDSHQKPNDPAQALPASAELIDFLCNCSSSVILALWQRLLLAYQTIEYPPMIAYCHFKMIEAILGDITSDKYAEDHEDQRQLGFLKSVQQIHEALLRVIDMTRTSAVVFECMDELRLQAIATALVQLLKILHYANFAEDEIRVGERLAPFEKETSRAKTYRQNVKLLTDCQLSCWIVLYMIFEEAAKEDRDKFPVENFDLLRMEILRSVHTSTGLRGFCGGSNRILLNLLKRELPTLRHVVGYDLEFSQVLVDLYGLNCFINPSWEQLPHDCAGDVSLDRAAAVQAVDLLLLQASKIKAAELYKHSLKDALERVNLVVARKRPSDAILRNREIFTHFFRTPINPLDLYRCLNGEGEINLVPMPEHIAALANQGWYFVMGYLALTKFRAQKRTNPGPTDELDTAISFFSQDLEYGAEKWETWFRLAQAFDSKLEDYVTWNADKLNKNMDEISQLQRSAIHCYRMATARATRITDPEFDASANVAELYADFATRIYASSRQPFDMKAFSLLDATRFLSTNSLIKVAPFKPLNALSAWKFAKVLYQRAIAGNPKRWSLHYMLGKCLWKLYMSSLAWARPYCDPALIITAFHKAIELLPREKKDKKEPVLEPHYKIVSTVHKLMTHRSSDVQHYSRPFTLDEACDLINLTPYANKVPRCEDMDEWDSYILQILKQLRNADKANWHHRMIVRSARIIYGEELSDGQRDFPSTLGAKHELTQQLFTKTMALQVWKPEFERPGRHFVYTHKYTDFFIEILRRLGDRAGIEQLVRRVRKRTGDYFEFEKLWGWLHNVYLGMLRKQSRIPFGQELTVFGTIEQSEFFKRKALLEKYCQDPEVKDPSLDVLHEAIEFKKINQGLEKPTTIDELIGDAYAYLFDTVGKRLWLEHREAGNANVTDVNKPQSKFIDLLLQPESTDLTGASTPGEQTPVKRKLGVGRREIRNAAEACMNKAAVSQPIVPDPPTREVQVIIHRRRSSPVSPTAHTHEENADDESELSEVDDDVANQGGSPSMRGSMFPGLVEHSFADDEGSGDDGQPQDGEGGEEEEGDEDGDDEGEDENDQQDVEMADHGDEEGGDHEERPKTAGGFGGFGGQVQGSATE